MARIEQDREDLLGEATALVPRCEMRVTGFPDPIVVGFRKNNAVSIYYGADPVYHFTSQFQLRRAFVEGKLIKSLQGELVSMTRTRTPGEVQLRSRTLSQVQQQALLEAMVERLQQLQHQLAAGQFSVIGQVPEEGDVIARIQTWLQNLLRAPVVVASRPNVS